MGMAARGGLYGRGFVARGLRLQLRCRRAARWTLEHIVRMQRAGK